MSCEHDFEDDVECMECGKMISEVYADLLASNEDLQRRIKESSFNCPSCGRHDFGLFQNAVTFKAKLDEALSLLEKLTASSEATALGPEDGGSSVRWVRWLNTTQDARKFLSGVNTR